MSPKRIVFIRHGQSIGNVDKSVYEKTPDYALRLTEKGRKQAEKAGQDLLKLFGNETVKVYTSPFWRTRDTLLGILSQWKGHPNYDAIVSGVYEDARLREQEWGHLRKRHDERENDDIEAERDAYGYFYFRFPGGESCADVFDRMSDFIGTMFRDFQKVDFPENALVVTHGMTIRLALMRWFHMTIEAYETLGNPANCSTYVLEREFGGKYVLKGEPRRHVAHHTWQYPEPLPWMKTCPISGV